MKKRIAILGIGGVGGYVGGHLAKKYARTNEFEVVFFARGEHGNKIKENGLQIYLDNQLEVVYPDIVTDDLENVPSIDYLICATKSYDLIESVTRLKNAISDKTVILPLLNGVDSYEKLKTLFPSSKVLNGCIFIVSKIKEPGAIEIAGLNHYVCVGSKELSPIHVVDLVELFGKAGINVRLSEDIDRAVWEKYIFISSLATLSTLKNKTIGQILEDDGLKNTLIELMKEVKSVATAKGITITESYLEQNISAMEKMPYATTSSMHRDQLAGKPIEIDSLTKYVIKLGNQLNVETKTFYKTLNS